MQIFGPCRRPATPAARGKRHAIGVAQAAGRVGHHRDMRIVGTAKSRGGKKSKYSECYSAHINRSYIEAGL